MNKKAFTLIELLVVIAIIGILATLAIVALQKVRSSARDAKRMADIKQIQTALELYYNLANQYPDQLTFGDTLEYDGVVLLDVVPNFIFPADGDCNNSNNIYDYNKINDSDYAIFYCLGDDSGSFKSGISYASPLHIQEVPGEKTLNIDLLSHWKLSQENYDIATNSILDKGDNLNYAINHGAVFTNDRYGNVNAAMLFDGVDDYLEVVDNDNLKKLGTEGDFTIQAWVQTTNGGTVFAYGYGSHTWGRFGLYANRLSIYTGSAYISTTDESSLDGDWHMLTGVYSRSDNKLMFYIDDELKTEVFWDANIENEESNTRKIGVLHRRYNNLGSFFNGKIDEIRIYNRALVASEISALYNQ